MASSNILQLPSNDDIEQAKVSSRVLSKFHSSERVTMSINSDSGDSETLILPGIAMQLLLDILSDISMGRAISVIPYEAELSTQQAANLLNVSRPYLIKLLENNEIKYRKVGSHRRVYVKDLLDYKEKKTTARKSSLEELSELSQALDMGY